MTKKDYILIAGALNEGTRRHVRKFGRLSTGEKRLFTLIANEISEVLQRDNPRFSLGSFEEATFKGLGIDIDDVPVSEQDLPDLHSSYREYEKLRRSPMNEWPDDLIPGKDLLDVEMTEDEMRSAADYYYSRQMGGK